MDILLLVVGALFGLAICAAHRAEVRAKERSDLRSFARFSNALKEDLEYEAWKERSAELKEAGVWEERCRSCHLPFARSPKMEFCPRCGVTL